MLKSTDMVMAHIFQAIFMKLKPAFTILCYYYRQICKLSCWFKPAI